MAFTAEFPGIRVGVDIDRRSKRMVADKIFRIDKSRDIDAVELFYQRVQPDDARIALVAPNADIRVLQILIGFLEIGTASIWTEPRKPGIGTIYFFLHSGSMTMAEPLPHLYLKRKRSLSPKKSSASR